MATRARERLLVTAELLFYAEGIRAVGLERILSTAEVGRASFYRHFPSKDDLVVEVLRRRHDVWFAWMRERVQAHGGGPLAVFDALAERFEQPDFRGCAFVNAMVESADPGSEAHVVAAQHKEKVTDYVTELVERAGYRDARPLAEQLVILMDGASVTALRTRSSEPACRARVMAATLLEHAY